MAVTAVTAREATIPGLRVLSAPLHKDARGFFCETYAQSKYWNLGIRDVFVQDSVSWSARNVLRGMHGDRRMSKIVQVLCGEVYDVVVDARIGSPAFGRWEAFELSRDNGRQIYIPPGCLHGFLVLSDYAVVSYKQSAEYDQTTEIAAAWNDPDLKIIWPRTKGLTLSEKDEHNPPFAAMRGR